MGIPWTDLLDYACTWAINDTTSQDCAADCTRGVFHSQKFSYNLHMWDPEIPNESIPIMWINPSTDKYRLKDFLSAYANQPGNCVDVSTFNSLSMTALGVGVELKRQYQGNGFVTNPVCPIGSDNADSGSYEMVPFKFHQQVHINDDVYDASLAFMADTEGSSYMDTPTGFPMPDYWQTPSGPSPPPLYGLTKRCFYFQFDWVSQNEDPGGPHYNPDEFEWGLNANLGSESVSYSTPSFTYQGVE